MPRPALFSRRGFLRGRLASERRAAVIPLLRPPGAVDEPLFLERCTRCDECIKSCPHDVLFRAGARYREAEGTPTFDPARAACLQCEDMPCVAACETGALVADGGFRMGTAHIDTQVCLAHQGTFCSVCPERCPVENAITVSGGRPTVNAAACTGCGVCRYVCPAPGNAVAVLPRRAT